MNACIYTSTYPLSAVLYVGWMIFSILNFRLAVVGYGSLREGKASIGVYEHDPIINVNESFVISKQK